MITSPAIKTEHFFPRELSLSMLSSATEEETTQEQPSSTVPGGTGTENCPASLRADAPAFVPSFAAFPTPSLNDVGGGPPVSEEHPNAYNQKKSSRRRGGRGIRGGRRGSTKRRTNNDNDVDAHFLTLDDGNHKAEVNGDGSQGKRISNRRNKKNQSNNPEKSTIGRGHQRKGRGEGNERKGQGKTKKPNQPRSGTRKHEKEFNQVEGSGFSSFIDEEEGSSSQQQTGKYSHYSSFPPLHIQDNALFPSLLPSNPTGASTGHETKLRSTTEATVPASGAIDGKTVSNNLWKNSIQTLQAIAVPPTPETTTGIDEDKEDKGLSSESYFASLGLERLNGQQSKKTQKQGVQFQTTSTSLSSPVSNLNEVTSTRHQPNSTDLVSAPHDQASSLHVPNSHHPPHSLLLSQQKQLGLDQPTKDTSETIIDDQKENEATNESRRLPDTTKTTKETTTRRVLPRIKLNMDKLRDRWWDAIAQKQRRERFLRELSQVVQRRYVIPVAVEDDDTDDEYILFHTSNTSSSDSSSSASDVWSLVGHEKKDVESSVAKNSDRGPTGPTDPCSSHHSEIAALKLMLMDDVVDTTTAMGTASHIDECRTTCWKLFQRAIEDNDNVLLQNLVSACLSVIFDDGSQKERDSHNGTDPSSGDHDLRGRRKESMMIELMETALMMTVKKDKPKLLDVLLTLGLEHIESSRENSSKGWYGEKQRNKKYKNNYYVLNYIPSMMLATRLGYEYCLSLFLSKVDRNLSLLACTSKNSNSTAAIGSKDDDEDRNNDDDDDGNNIFHICCAGEGDESLLRLLLDHVLSSTMTGHVTSSATTTAAATTSGKTKHHQQQVLSKFLLKKNNKLQTPFHVACMYGRVDFVELLLNTCSSHSINNSINYNVNNGGAGTSTGKKSLLSKLLSSLDNQQQTPLLAAVAADAPDVVLCLIMWRGNHRQQHHHFNKNKNIFINNNNNNYHQHHYSDNEQITSIGKLQSNGKYNAMSSPSPGDASTSSSTHSPPCPLVWAAKHLNIEMIQLLLQFGDQSADEYRTTEAISAVLQPSSATSTSSTAENVDSMSITPISRLEQEEMQLEAIRILIQNGGNPFAEIGESSSSSLSLGHNNNNNINSVGIHSVATFGTSEIQTALTAAIRLPWWSSSPSSSSSYPRVLRKLVQCGQTGLKRRQLARRRDPNLQRQPRSFFTSIESKENHEMKMALNASLKEAIYSGYSIAVTTAAGTAATSSVNAAKTGECDTGGNLIKGDEEKEGYDADNNRHSLALQYFGAAVELFRLGAKLEESDIPSLVQSVQSRKLSSSLTNKGRDSDSNSNNTKNTSSTNNDKISTIVSSNSSLSSSSFMAVYQHGFLPNVTSIASMTSSSASRTEATKYGGNRRKSKQKHVRDRITDFDRSSLSWGSKCLIGMPWMVHDMATTDCHCRWLRDNKWSVQQEQRHNDERTAKTTTNQSSSIATRYTKNAGDDDVDENTHNNHDSAVVLVTTDGDKFKVTNHWLLSSKSGKLASAIRFAEMNYRQQQKAKPAPATTSGVSTASTSVTDSGDRRNDDMINENVAPVNIDEDRDGADDGAAMELPINMSSHHCKFFLQHIYHGSIACGWSREDHLQQNCRDILELMLIAEEYLCPSLMQECEMRLLDGGEKITTVTGGGGIGSGPAGTRCFCWSCAKSVRPSISRSMDNDTSSSTENEETVVADCMYVVDSSASLLTGSNVLDVLAVVQHLQSTSYEPMLTPASTSSNQLLYQISTVPIKISSFQCMRPSSLWSNYDDTFWNSNSAFVTLKDMAIKVILKSFGDVLNSETFRASVDWNNDNNSNNIDINGGDYDDNLGHRGDVGKHDNKGEEGEGRITIHQASFCDDSFPQALLLLQTCLEELEDSQTLMI